MSIFFSVTTDICVQEVQTTVGALLNHLLLTGHSQCRNHLQKHLEVQGALYARGAWYPRSKFTLKERTLSYS